jgi:hypothetical protein
VNNELERLWKALSFHNLRYLLSNYLPGPSTPRETSVRIASLRDEKIPKVLKYSIITTTLRSIKNALYREHISPCACLSTLYCQPLNSGQIFLSFITEDVQKNILLLLL